MLSSILGCNCLFKPVYHILQILKSLFCYSGWLNPKPNDLFFIAESFNWDVSVSNKNIFILFEYSTCFSSKIKFENIIAKVSTLLPSTTRFHMENGVMEVCVEDFSYGAGLQYGILSTILYGFFSNYAYGEQNCLYYIRFYSFSGSTFYC